MEYNILDPVLELPPVGQNSWMDTYSTIIGHFQLFINGHGGEDNLLVASMKFGRVSIKCCLEVLKPVVELGHIAVIM